MSVYNLAFRAGIPLGALSLGKLIPILGIPTAVTGIRVFSGGCGQLFSDRHDESADLSPAG